MQHEYVVKMKISNDLENIFQSNVESECMKIFFFGCNRFLIEGSEKILGVTGFRSREMITFWV